MPPLFDHLAHLFQNKTCKMIKLGCERWVKLKQTKYSCHHFREEILGENENTQIIMDNICMLSSSCIGLYYKVNIDK